VERIVVGVDGSDESRAALAWAVEEARHHGATVDAVHAWSYPAAAYISGMVPSLTFPADELAAGAKGVLDRACDSVDAGDVQVNHLRAVLQHPRPRRSRHDHRADRRRR